MDDLSGERLRRFEDRLTAVEQAVSGMEGRLSAQLGNGIRGFELVLQTAAAGIRAHIDLRFGETLRRFQEVTDEREKVALLEERLAKLEAKLAPPPPAPQGAGQ